MLLDIYDIDDLFDKRCDCFGAVGVGLGAGAAIAANVAVLGAVISTVGVIQQGKQAASQAAFQSQVAQNNATIAQQQATRARQQARIDSQDYARGQSDMMASRRALLGTTGGDAGLGSPLAVSSDFAGESILNTMRIRNQGEVNANRLEQEVMNQQSQAGLYASQGRNAVSNSYMKAGGNLFSSGSSIWGKAKGGGYG
tara:strand:+ start:38284 stop:38877 length:594 start_codon:yes stop_codon:yes gene_type:complete